MSPVVYTWLVGLHATLATLGLAVLLHPVVTLRRRSGVSRAMLWTSDLAAILMSAPFAVGWLLYPTYRASIKPPLWLAHPDVVLRFETKEHLAAMAVALVVSGAVTLRLAGRPGSGRRAAWTLLVCGWSLGVITASLGLYIHGRAHPGF